MWVKADPDQLLQVFLNLLLNAVAAVSADTGMVEVASKSSPTGTPMLCITDNGYGIAEEKLPHIFDPFFSLREGGIGLGLSVVYTLLKQNDASLHVTSRMGEGTSFEISFHGQAGLTGESTDDRNCNRR
jgi:signal transduction histidine kinase